MTTKTSPKPNHIPLSGIPETPDERAARSRHEAALIAQGAADSRQATIMMKPKPKPSSTSSKSIRKHRYPHQGPQPL